MSRDDSAEKYMMGNETLKAFVNELWEEHLKSLYSLINEKKLNEMVLWCNYV